jgi:hypothetical protein
LDDFKKKLVPVSSAETELGHTARKREAATSRMGRPERA